MMKIFKSVVAMVSQLIRGSKQSQDWLSSGNRSTPVERTGRVVRVRLSSRGLSIQLHTGKSVTWPVDRVIAWEVFSRLNNGQSVDRWEVIHVVSDDGSTTLRSVVDRFVADGLLMFENHRYRLSSGTVIEIEEV